MQQYIAILGILSAISMVGYDVNDNADTETSSYDYLKSQLAETGNSIFFDVNSYYIRPSEIQLLSNLASFLEKNDCDFLIEGHTDEHGSRNSSIALGFHRAYSVFNYFLAGGINQSRMKVTSYGKEVPSMLGRDENAYAKNRRVVIVLKECR
ncbi:OmpA family protein [Candidatus Liberibacter brunswickensis]|uniref:OmpA family protein n=1 Tax=Candidatus Liberibacter brunswickensis TaxID=1968796 RepID=UPI002FE030A4